MDPNFTGDFITQNTIISSMRSYFGTKNIIFDMFISFAIIWLFSIVKKIKFNDFYDKIKNKLFPEYLIEINIVRTSDRNNFDINNENKILFDEINKYINKNIVQKFKQKLEIITNKNVETDDDNYCDAHIFNYYPINAVKLNYPFDDIIINQTVEINNGDKSVRTEYMMQIKSTKSIKNLENFINEMYNNYSRENNKNASIKNIYSHYCESNRDTVYHSKFKFRSNKSINDIFFPEKNRLVKCIDKFMEGGLKVSKFTLLLHGPPGTGKTSLIKALINYTGRSVKYIKLSNINSFRQIIDVFLSERFYADPGCGSYNLPLNKTIIIMEDVDAENKIVHKRNPDDNNHSLNATEINSEPKINKIVESKISKIMDSSSIMNPITLSDILQMMDGLFEATGVIIIMTTNHIEKLDPAFIRPGRITMKLHLRELLQKCAFDMIHHYYPNETYHYIKTHFECITDYVLTPAELENMCIESNTINELHKLVINHLRDRELNKNKFN
jgi:ATP-dependent Zn protease